MHELTHLSLFSGVGGLDIAAEWAGMRTVGFCEWAPYPRAILQQRWPEVPIWEDIRTLTRESFYAASGLRSVDVVSGGFPCQPFSAAGQRRGTDDDRYLWPEMLRVIKDLGPSWVIGENVAGLVSMAQSATPFGVESREIARHADADYYTGVYVRQETMLLPQILKDLGDIGYAVQPFAVPACGVDAQHQRERLAIVANRNGF